MRIYYCAYNKDMNIRNICNVNNTKMLTSWKMYCCDLWWGANIIESYCEHYKNVKII